MTKYFKNLKQAKKAVEVPPRSLQEIQEAYGKLVAQAGQAQYQIYVFSEDLKRLNNALLDVNREAAARQALDTTDKTEVKSGAV